MGLVNVFFFKFRVRVMVRVGFRVRFRNRVRVGFRVRVSFRLAAV